MFPLCFGGTYTIPEVKITEARHWQYASSGGSVYNALSILYANSELYMIGSNRYSNYGVAVTNTQTFNLVLEDVKTFDSCLYGSVAVKNDGTVWFTGSTVGLFSSSTRSTWTDVTSICSSAIPNFSTRTIKKIRMTGYIVLILFDDGDLYGIKNGTGTSYGVVASAAYTFTLQKSSIVDFCITSYTSTANANALVVCHDGTYVYYCGSGYVGTSSGTYTSWQTLSSLPDTGISYIIPGCTNKFYVVFTSGDVWFVGASGYTGVGSTGGCFDCTSLMPSMLVSSDVQNFYSAVTSTASTGYRGTVNRYIVGSDDVWFCGGDDIIQGLCTPLNSGNTSYSTYWGSFLGALGISYSSLSSMFALDVGYRSSGSSSGLVSGLLLFIGNTVWYIGDAISTLGLSASTSLVKVSTPY